MCEGHDEKNGDFIHNWLIKHLCFGYSATYMTHNMMHGELMCQRLFNILHCDVYCLFVLHIRLSWYQWKNNQFPCSALFLIISYRSYGSWNSHESYIYNKHTTSMYTQITACRLHSTAIVSVQDNGVLVSDMCHVITKPSKLCRLWINSVSKSDLRYAIHLWPSLASFPFGFLISVG